MLTKHSAYSFLLLLLSPPLQADALTDGTLGPQVHPVLNISTYLLMVVPPLSRPPTRENLETPFNRQ